MKEGTTFDEYLARSEAITNPNLDRLFMIDANRSVSLLPELKGSIGFLSFQKKFLIGFNIVCFLIDFLMSASLYQLISGFIVIIYCDYI